MWFKMHVQCTHLSKNITELTIWTGLRKNIWFQHLQALFTTLLFNLNHFMLLFFLNDNLGLILHIIWTLIFQMMDHCTLQKCICRLLTTGSLTIYIQKNSCEKHQPSWIWIVATWILISYQGLFFVLFLRGSLNLTLQILVACLVEVFVDIVVAVPL